MNIIIKKLVSSLLLALLPSLMFGQMKVKGIIIDRKTQEPIEYANIRIFEKGVGTVSDMNGSFELLIPNELIKNPITVKHIGYADALVDIKESSTNLSSLKIAMEPVVNNLKELTVVSTRKEIIGYQPNGEQVKGFFKAGGLGLEGATLIKNQGQIVLTDFNLNVLKIPFDSLKFRLNIYTVQSVKPYKKVNTSDIVFTLRKTDIGIFSLPLQDKNIQVMDNFICSIELIESFGQNAENAEFLFSAIPGKAGFIYKKAISLGKWESIKNYSLCFWLDIKR